MLADVLTYLRCPVCGGALAPHGPTIRCPRGHAFDVARQGYVHLAPGRLTHPGDSAAMVAARAEFLAAGHLDFIAAALTAAVPDPQGLVLDVGAGTGHHLATVLTAWPQTVGLAVDISKPAVRRAARAHPRAAAVLADGWRRLPVADRAATAIVNVFAPRNGAEFARVLRADGHLLVVTAAEGHLGELIGQLGMVRVDPDKDQRLAAGLGRWFRRDHDRVHTHRLRLSRAQVQAVVGMGPSAHHLDPRRLAERVAALPEPMPVTASVRLSRFTLT